MASDMSKILIIGGTGKIGKFITAASARLGHPTFVLVRDAAPADPAKAELLRGFVSSGITLVKGDLNDHESLVKAIKAVDVVISTVGTFQMKDQPKIIAAIKEAGNVKRFLPSEFGTDVHHDNSVEPCKELNDIKAQFRRAVEAEGIPHTYIICHFFAGIFLQCIGQAPAPGVTGPPTDKYVIMGEGNQKAIILDENDIATFTIRTVDDPRTLNKSLFMRPAGNIVSQEDLISLWEKKVGRSFERVYVSEEEVFKQIQETTFPVDALLAIFHSAYIRGNHTNFEIDPASGVEATELYPDVKYTTVDEYLDRLL